MNFSIGQWEVSVPDNLITRNDTKETVKLEPKVMEVLVYMTEHQGQVISLDELIEKVWQGRIVGDHAIYRIINQLRKALNPEDKNAYIKTIPKKGYKFIVEVSQTEKTLTSQSLNEIDSTPLLIDSNQSSPASFSKSVLFKSLTFLFCLLLIAIVWKTFFAAKMHYLENGLISEFNPVLTKTGIYEYPSFSDNGKYIVYSAKQLEDETYNLYLKNEESGNILLLTNSAADEVNARVDNTASHVVYIEKISQACSIKLLIKKDNIYESKDLLDCNQNEYLDIELSADGRILYYTYRDELNPISRIFSLDVQTGRKSQLTNYLVNKAIGDRELVLDEKNERLFFLRNENFRVTEAVELDLNTQQEKTVFEFDGWIDNLNYRTNENSITYKSGRSIDEYCLDHGHKREIILSLNDDIYHYDFDSENDNIVISSGNVVEGIWEVTLDEKDELVSETLLVQSDGQDFMPRYANNSEDFAFVSDRSGSQQIWLHKVNENNDIQVTNFKDGRFIDWFRWSPDNKHILSYDNESIYKVQIDTGEVEQLVHTEEYSNASIPLWSFSGNEIYFTSDKSGDYQLYRLNSGLDLIEKISEDGKALKMDRDLNSYYFMYAHRPGLWLSNNNTVNVVDESLDLGNHVRTLYLALDDIYYFNLESNKVHRIRQSKENVEHELPLLPYDHLFAVSASNNKYLYPKQVKAKTRLLSNVSR